VNAAFGYVNFVERVGEGGIETIEYSRYVKTKFDGRVLLFLNATHRTLGYINFYKRNRAEDEVQNDKFEPADSESN